jgi:hypothetical protein
MRTTIDLADDVAAGVDKLRRERDLGLSEAVNDLVRAGLTKQEGAEPQIEFKTYDLGIGIDVSNIGEAIETIERDGPFHA